MEEEKKEPGMKEPEPSKITVIPVGGESGGKGGEMAAEGKEAVPELQLIVAGPCKNPNGAYVGLNKAQREKLGVKVGDPVVIIMEDGTLLLYMTGDGSKELLKEKGKFTANGIALEGQRVRIRRLTNELKEGKITLHVETGIEADTESHERRRAIISNRFPNLNSDQYVALPSGVCDAAGLRGQREEDKEKRILPISQMLVRVGSMTHRVPVVPTGTGFGLTRAAAELLGIPEQLQKIRMAVEEKEGETILVIA